MAELWERSATELADLVRRGDASCREVIEAHLDRIDAVNGAVNAVAAVLAEDALAAADAADARGPGRPLHGVPFTVKENIDVAGSATTQGLVVLAGAVPARDAPVVERMRAAGAIPVARTNMPELGLRISTDNPLRGRTLNPWDPAVTAGGSSGGDGVALATGMTPIGLGNDIGGSVRNPAFCCGVAGLKPSHGRIPHASDLAPVDPPAGMQILYDEGIMARSVADLLAVLEAVQGRDPRDPGSVDVPLGAGDGHRSAALVTEAPGVDLAASQVAEIRRAGEALDAAGWTVVEAAPPELERVTDVWLRIMAFGLGPALPVIQPLMSEPASRLAARLLGAPVGDAAAALLERRRLQRLWSEFFADHPVVVGPTWSGPPFEHDADLDPDTGFALTVDRLRFVTPGNLLGIPGCAVPTGVVDGLPVGIQVYADLWQDRTCLDAAGIVERAVGTITPIDPRSR